jgi:hypothetical protein
MRKKENDFFSRIVSFVVNHHNTSPFFFVGRFLSADAYVNIACLSRKYVLTHFPSTQ